MGAELGFEVEGLELVGADGRPAAEADRVSSTASASRSPTGDLDAANDLLGRPTRCGASWPTATSGAASSGSPRPTCRCPATILLPADGIYAGWYVRPDGVASTPRRSRSAGGRRSTTRPHASLLEAHLLDFAGDLYDEHARVRFVARLRGEVKFDSVDALVVQIGPTSRVRRVLGSA